MLPVAGGGMAFAYRAFNETVSFISGWAAFGAFVSIIPWEAIQITDVLGYLIPNIKAGDPPLPDRRDRRVYLVTIIIGTICSLLLFALNMARPGSCRHPAEGALLRPGGRRHRGRHRLPGGGQRQQLAAHL